MTKDEAILKFKEAMESGNDSAIEVLMEFAPEAEELVQLHADSWSHDEFEEDGEPYDVFRDRFQAMTEKYLGITFADLD